MTRKSNSYYAGDDIETPIRPGKPGTFDRNDPQSMRDYADKMESWLNEKESYEVRIRAYRSEVSSRKDELRYDLAEENDMNIAQATVLFDAAWEDSHSEGFSAVIDSFEQLVEIVENFNRSETKPVKKEPTYDVYRRN
jgi:hypothetical protein